MPKQSLYAKVPIGHRVERQLPVAGRISSKIFHVIERSLTFSLNLLIAESSTRKQHQRI